MPDAENWAKYGFPDDIMFRSPYLPLAGLVKAVNERREAVDLDPFPELEYFEVDGGMYWESNFNYALSEASRYYVDPDAVSSATRYEQCFWFWNDLWDKALDGEDLINVTSFMRPRYSVKWAIWTYNQINLLRYVATTKGQDWPGFEYRDIYNTFKFKA